ncbi:CDP-diacylglycerol-glycerol-3-phosphate 3-phosphatidyltransferase [Cutibacterium acnes JCM 18918]|nr:CDP-diacylglycerol-glycerol-3-phosphate 3-phosphatidyltransferase [Cutibacterium acnes JCM 18918]
MLEHFRAGWAKVMNPIADALLRAHVTPDVVTWIGTIGAVLMALICFPQLAVAGTMVGYSVYLLRFA